jgi:hypothetical protein
MADQPIASLSRAREQKITELSQHFANDDLTLDDLERRIERVYKAGSLVALDEITADLKSAVVSPPAPAPGFGRSKLARPSGSVPATYELESGRVLSLMSSTKRVGRWAVPRKLDVVAIMSDTKIDLTHAALPPGVIEMELRAVMASFKLVVPPNMRVINEIHSVMSNVRSRADELGPDGLAADANAPVLRLSGLAFMADVNVVVRRREEPVFDDDDDDD